MIRSTIGFELFAGLSDFLGKHWFDARLADDSTLERNPLLVSVLV